MPKWSGMSVAQHWLGAPVDNAATNDVMPHATNTMTYFTDVDILRGEATVLVTGIDLNK